MNRQPVLHHIFRVVLLCALAVGCNVQPAANAAEQDCNAPYTAIPQLQGAGRRTTLDGEQTTEGVVTASYQRDNQLRGYFIQDPQGDGDPTTSDGLFIFDPQTLQAVSPGTVVRVRGIVQEQVGNTELALRYVQVCGKSEPIKPIVVQLPWKSSVELEQYEGMLITFPQTLTVSNVENLGRYGEFSLSMERLSVPTMVAQPGRRAEVVQDENALDSLLVDDANKNQNPAQVIFPAPELTADNTLRAGYTIANITGVLTYTADAKFKLLPTVTPAFNTKSNPRTAKPKDVGGTLRVASFNVLNYFNGDGHSGGFPTLRGAESSPEFERQRAKIIAALLAINADVVGLIEMENDRAGASSAVQDLVNGLNDAAGTQQYAALKDPSTGVGDDDIRIAIIYQPALVTPINSGLSEPSSIFKRSPIAQTFRENSSGAVFNLIIVHLKSKDCQDAQSQDVDRQDGQGCYNATRVEQARLLLAFIQKVQQASRDKDVIVMGDFNAYAMESPIQTLVQSGLVDVMPKLASDDNYSFNFGGQFGALDHAMATASLMPQISGATFWHINADEPRILDYNYNFKSPAQHRSFYAPDPYRSSDHDPLIVGLTLTK